MEILCDDTYRRTFVYDDRGRLTGSRQYAGGARTDTFVERGLTYDRNGNMLTLQRTANGAIADSLIYQYAGNRLAALSGTTSASYAYDANGNMVHDGANDLDITYNRLNLIEKVRRDGHHPGKIFVSI